MLASHAALAGGTAGLILGLAKYLVMSTLVRRALMRQAEVSSDPDALDEAKAQARSIKLALATSNFIALPVLGFAIGSLLGIPTGARP